MADNMNRPKKTDATRDPQNPSAPIPAQSTNPFAEGFNPFEGPAQSVPDHRSAK